MKVYTFVINGFFKGEVHARTLWGAKSKARVIYTKMFIQPITEMIISCKVVES
jgi:hypothetical protein